jgi:uncharacterized repeat protein (TIGR03943 family)
MEHSALSLRTQRSLQALILVGLGLFLLQKIWSGTLYWYINERFMLLILFAGLGLLALAQAVAPWRRRRPPGEPGEAHPHADAEAHEHSHASLSAWALVIVALPVILGLLIPARPLGASAIANKGINTTAPLTTGGAAEAARLDTPATDRTIIDWVRAFNYADDVSAFEGQPADVVGFVFHDGRLASDQFMAGRFIITCCAADASAIGLIVRWPEAPALPNDTWVRVRGTVTASTLDGRPTPLIVAEAVEPVSPPSHPYLYP